MLDIIIRICNYFSDSVYYVTRKLSGLIMLQKMNLHDQQ